MEQAAATTDVESADQMLWKKQWPMADRHL
jgi:hypothetical protein